MFKKCCRYCKYCYCADESDVSGLNCVKNTLIKLIELDKVADCDNYKFSLLKLLLGV